MITFTLEMNEAQASALAQFVKRVGFSEMRSNAVDDFGSMPFSVEVDITGNGG